jgi:hypothetical protein
LVEAFVRTSCRLFHDLHPIFNARGGEVGALLSLKVRPLFVPWKPHKELRHFVSGEFKNKINSTLYNYLDEEWDCLVEEVVCTRAFVATTASDFSPPDVDSWQQILLPRPKECRRELNVGLWYEPFVTSTKAGLDCAGIVVNFGLISCRKLVVDYVFRERRNLIWSQTRHILDCHCAIVCYFNTVNTGVSINDFICISVFWKK